MNFAKPVSLMAVTIAIFASWSLCSGADKRHDQTDSNAESLVQDALQAELEGDLSRRTELLYSALDQAPDHPTTNWHLGYVRSQQGKWMSVSEHQRLNLLNETQLAYRSFRDRLEGNPQSDWRLGEWCTRHGMRDIATVHYSRVVQNSAYDLATQEKAMRRLGLQLKDGRLLSEKEIKAAKQSAKDFKCACERWVPRLKGWQKVVNSQTPRSAQASQELLDADDPQLVRVLELFIPQSGEPFGEALVDKLAMSPSHEATQSLVKFAVLSDWQRVRQSATGELKNRSMHDYVPLLMSGLVSPIRTEWTIAEQADGSLSYRHMFFREGAEEDYAFETEFILRPSNPNDGRSLEELLGRGLDALQSSQVAGNRELAVARANTEASSKNQYVFEALEQTTRAQVDRNPNAWRQWWLDYNDVDGQKQTRYGYQREERQMTRVSMSLPLEQSSGPPQRAECFVAGTQVWTETGLEAIESIRIGDRVLAQQTETGELTFKPVQATTLRSPVPVVQLTVGSEKITSTLGHPLWVTGEGWRMAKLIQPGDQLHALHGGVFLDDVERLDAPVRVYNLVVADFHTYFVGETGVLVHDNMYRQPSRVLVPGLKAD